MTNINDLVSQAIIKLFESERFYAEIICTMDRYIDELTPTAGVCIRDNIELHINPTFFASLSVDERVAILKHECEHILRDHISRAKEVEPDIHKKTDDVADIMINRQKHQALNIAMDCAINGGLRNLPTDGMFPERFQLENGHTFEWYHEHLKDNKKMKEINNFDGHDLWNMSDKDKDMIREKVKQAINQAASKATGHMTAEQQLLVEKLNKASKNWRQELQRFVSNTVNVDLDTSRKKRNRRYGIKMPGLIKTERLTLAIGIDTSGSISDEALVQFMSEIKKIAEYADVYIAEADSEVKNHYKFDPKKKIALAGRGGTAYKPVFDHFNKRKDIDGLIYFGDMDTYEQEVINQPKYPVLWAIVGSQKPPVPWGSKIKIEIT